MNWTVLVYGGPMLFISKPFVVPPKKEIPLPRPQTPPPNPTANHHLPKTQ